MRRVTITVPDETLERVHGAVERGGASSVSAYFADLAAQQSREEDLLELIDRLDAELGAPSEADVEWARQVTYGAQ
jgi:hypothetical protein